MLSSLNEEDLSTALVHRCYFVTERRRWLPMLIEFVVWSGCEIKLHREQMECDEDWNQSMM